MGGVTFQRVNVPGTAAFYANLSASVVPAFTQVSVPSDIANGAIIRVLDGQNSVLATGSR